MSLDRTAQHATKIWTKTKGKDMRGEKTSTKILAFDPWMMLRCGISATSTNRECLWWISVLEQTNLLAPQLA